jgi:hypothetical protein
MTMTSRSRAVLSILFSILFLVGIAYAVVIHDTVHYEHSVRAIRGRVTSLGAVMRVVWVDVYDNAQVCLDDSLTQAEKRKRQTKIVSAEPNDNGEFKITHLPKGFYEVEFGNRGNGGYNILSVLIQVDPKGTKDGLCVNLSQEGLGGQSTATRCSAR